METNEIQTIKLLNDLIRINNDRIEGYERAVGDIDDPQLKSLFYKMAQESRKFKIELAGVITKMGGTLENGTTVTGKIFRAWMNFKAAIAGKDKNTILATAQSVEEIGIETYGEIISSGNLLPDCYNRVKEQHACLKHSRERLQEKPETVNIL